MFSSTRSSRPTSMARPRPAFWKAKAARMTLGSSPSAKTIRFSGDFRTTP